MRGNRTDTGTRRCDLCVTPAKWRRYELWMTTLVDVDTGTGLGVVDPQGCAGVKKWLAVRSAAWHNGVQVLAIDLSAGFGKAITDALP
jgi:transposase